MQDMQPTYVDIKKREIISAEIENAPVAVIVSRNLILNSGSVKRAGILDIKVKRCTGSPRKS